MAYDPERHHRRSIRLPAYDYASAGAYFVTIVTHGRVPWLGRVVEAQVRLSQWGAIVARCWRRIPRHFRHALIDEWIIMPDHVHGILVLDGAVACDAPAGHCKGEASAVVCRDGAAVTADASPLRYPRGTAPGSVGAIVQTVKSVSARRIRIAVRRLRPDLELAPHGSPVWQRNYYERVIRDDLELDRIRRYIRDNPRSWTEKHGRR